MVNSETEDVEDDFLIEVEVEDVIMEQKTHHDLMEQKIHKK